MKKLLVVFGLLVSGAAFGQITVMQTLPSKNLVIYKNGPQDTSMVVIFKVVDTLHVSKHILKIPGIVIQATSDTTFWVRNQSCTRWFKIMSGVDR